MDETVETKKILYKKCHRYLYLHGNCGLNDRIGAKVMHGHLQKVDKPILRKK